MNVGVDRAIEIAEQAEAHFANGSSGLFIPTTGAGDLTVIPRADNAVNTGEQVAPYKYIDEEQAFPKVDPGMEPFGNMVLLQLRHPPMRTAGGLILDAETRKTERDNCQIAKVVAVGALCFKDRRDFNEWPEGAWCKPGDYVRIPKYQGDRFAVACTVIDGYTDPFTKEVIAREVSDIVEFVMMKDLSLLGLEKNPLTRRTFL